MKTTVVIDDVVASRLKREAARQDRTMSEIVEIALRLYLSPKAAACELPPLPVFKMGKPLVDYADQDALEQALEKK